MARAPEEQARVAQIGIPGERLTAAPTPTTFGANIGETVQGLGQALYTREVREANQTAFLAADRQLSETQTALQVRISEMQGMEAVKAAPSLLDDEWKKSTDEIEKGLSNDLQRQAFHRASVTRYEQLNKAMQFHVSAEKTKYADGETSAYLKASTDSARMNASDPDAVQLEKERQVGAIAEMATRKGMMGSKMYTQQVAEVLSNTNTEVVKGLLYQNKDLSASAFYEKHKDEFTAKDRDAIERAIEEGSTRGESLRITRGLVADGKDLGESLKEIEKIDDPKVQDAARARIKQHFADELLAVKLHQDALYEHAFNRMDKAVQGATPGSVVNARDVIPPDVWTALKPQEKASLQSWGEHHPRAGDRTNDDRKWLEFLDLPAASVAKLSRSDYDTNYRMFFDNATRGRADAQWNGAKNAVDTNDAKDPKVSATQTFHDQVQDTFRLSGLVDPHQHLSKYDDNQVTMMARFEREATARVEQAELANKRKFTATERQAIIDDVRDRAIKQVWVPGTFFDSKKPVLALSEDEKGQVMVPIHKIPAKELEALRNYMLSNGADPTPDKLRRAYAQFLLGNRKGIDAIVEGK